MAAARCSFCGMTEAKGAKLVAGTEASICHSCVVSFMGIVEAEASSSSGEGQILARFPDGTAKLCEQRHAWRGFRHNGIEHDWCVAQTTIGGERLAVVTVRPSSEKRPVIGSTLPADTEPSDEDARRVIDAHGSTPRRTPVVVKSIGKSPIKERDQSLGRTLQRLGFISDQQVTNFLSQQYRIPTINLAEYEIDPEILKLVPKELCVRLRLVPVSRAGSSLIVAMADPTDQAAMDEVGQVTGYRVEPVIASQVQIEDAISKYYAGS